MPLDTRVQDFPDWMQPRSPWTQNDVMRAVNTGIQYEQQQQAQVLQLRELALRRQSTTIMNDARLKQIEEAEAEVADLPLLQEYARNPDGGIPDFRSPKSFNKLQAIDLSRSRSDLGKQTAADLKDFNTRLLKVGADDRAIIRDMQREGAPEAEVYGVLGQVEERQRVKLQSEKTFAPSPIRKLLDEANDAEISGNMDEAETLRKRARTLSDGGRGATIDPSKMSDADKFRAGVLRTRLAAISATISNPLKREELGAAGAKEMTAERDTLTQDLEDILKKYSGTFVAPAPDTAPAAPAPAETPKPNFRFEPGKGLVPVP